MFTLTLLAITIFFAVLLVFRALHAEELLIQTQRVILSLCLTILSVILVALYVLQYNAIGTVI